MPEVGRHTIIAHGRLTMREVRLLAARERRHGLQVMTFEQLAARLAGGLAQPVDDDALREAITTVLAEATSFIARWTAPCRRWRRMADPPALRSSGSSPP